MADDEFIPDDEDSGGSDDERTILREEARQVSRPCLCP